MPKRLVMCCDGTWNTLKQQSGGRPVPTNVTLLSFAVLPTGPDGRAQIPYYHPGVGTRFGERYLGGAFGVGLSRDVRDVYRFIVENYEPDDELFFFGFSRGAFTARSAAGFVRNCGILRPEHADRVDEAYALYRSRQSPPASEEAKRFRAKYAQETRIRFIGVWDTVGALGIPLNGLRFFNFLNRGVQFHDTALSSTVDAGFQALALDEHRRAFAPAVWDPLKPGDETHVEQVWFTGVHCNVGGGYAQHGLSDLALEWMIRAAAGYRLGVDVDALRAGTLSRDGVHPDAVVPDPLGPAAESRTSFYKLIPSFDRTIDRGDQHNEWAGSGAVERRKADPGYKSVTLETYFSGEHRVSDVSA